VEISALVDFSKLVSDTLSSEGVSSLLAKTAVERCGAFHALVFGTGDDGYTVRASFGGCDIESNLLDLRDVDSISDLRAAILNVCGDRGYGLRVFPLISDARLFGAVCVLYRESHTPTERETATIEGLAELTAISLNRTLQHQKLQQAFDDLRASQEVLLRTEKFRALGQVSAGIAHDLKNLLNPLVLYTDYMRDVVDRPDEIRDTLGRMERVLTRGMETVERLRDFSRLSPEESDTTATDLDAMVREAIEISKPKLATTNLALELGAPPPVLLRPADCITALVNLVFNAVDAVEGKGKITVRTGSSDGGSWVEVADNGPGIPPEIRERILEPLFTTKGNRGTGLGVSTVYAFVQRHTGRLEIESKAGDGARFRMWFPALAAEQR